jgi:transposase
MRSLYLACDETWLQVLKEKGRKPETDSWMWLRTNPSDKEKIALFDYDPHRSGEVAQRLFAEYRGILQVDGYGAYNILEKQEGLIRIGCNMHGRRKFESAKTIGAKQGQSLAEVALKFYSDLYDLEERLKQLSWEERHELRQKEAAPIWAAFKSWAELTAPKVPPKSKIGEAFHYFLNEYDYLIGYMRDGRLEMDNGFAERAIKYFAIGRNNWLFSDTVAGAEASSLFYSFVVTAKLNGVNPLHALTRIFTEVPNARSIEDYERLADLLVTRPPPA